MMYSNQLSRSISSRVIQSIALLSITLGGLMPMSGVAADKTALSPFQATYKFTIENKFSGKANRQLVRQADGTWQFRFDAALPLVGKANMVTSFDYQGGQYYPFQSLTSYKIYLINRQTVLDFDHNKRQIVTQYKGKTRTLPMPSPALEDLTLEMQIREDLLNDNLQSSYTLASKKEVKKVKFNRLADATVTVPAGTYNVVVIERDHEDKDRVTKFWLAPSLKYLPVKVTQNNDGKVYDFELAKMIQAP